MTLHRRALLAGLALPCAARATDGPSLEVTGAITPPGPRRLTLAEMEALGASELVTTTPWTEGPQRFTGVPLQRLIAAIGARGTSLRAVALNDYAVTMPIAETVAQGAFLATRLNGAPLPVRTRGPFWMVFPWLSRPELETAVVRQRSIWQIARLEVA